MASKLNIQLDLKAKFITMSKSKSILEVLHIYLLDPLPSQSPAVWLLIGKPTSRKSQPHLFTQ